VTATHGDDHVKKNDDQEYFQNHNIGPRPANSTMNGTNVVANASVPVPPNLMSPLDAADVWNKCLAQRFFARTDMVMQVEHGTDSMKH
jgi:hypothetical protein